MNPDKWFDYLEGKLPDWERTQLEEQLPSDPQLQRELAAARRIHSSMGGDSREVLVEDPAVAAHGRKMALRIGTAFLVLIALNVGIGLLFIAWKESSNPNLKLLKERERSDSAQRQVGASTPPPTETDPNRRSDEQTRRQVEESVRRASAALPLAGLELSDISITSVRGGKDKLADQVVATAQRLGGSATKNLPDTDRIRLMVDLPGNREGEFRAAMAVLNGAAPVSLASPAATESKAAKGFVVEINETP